MYKSKTEPFGKFERIIISGPRGNSMSVIPDYGANVNELIFAQRGTGYSLLDGVQSYDELLTDKAFKSSVLLPWPNRIRDGKYTFGGKTYQLPINEADRNNALHGFVFRKKFEVEDIKLQPDAAELILSYAYTGGEEGYPFKFSLRLRYIISDGDGFSVSMEIRNDDTVEIPMGAGWHPYIKMPVKVDDLILQFPQCQIHEVDNQMIPTGRTEDFEKFAIPRLLGSYQLDSCLLLVDPDAVTKTMLIDEKSGLKLKFWQETGQNAFNYLQVYTPTGRSSIAVEPMTCGVDVFNNQQGLAILKPGEKLSARFGLKLVE